MVFWGRPWWSCRTGGGQSGGQGVPGAGAGAWGDRAGVVAAAPVQGGFAEGGGGACQGGGQGVEGGAGQAGDGRDGIARPGPARAWWRRGMPRPALAGAAAGVGWAAAAGCRV